MRKLLAATWLALIMTLAVAPGAAAAQGDLVTDEAGVLSAADQASLNDRAQQISAAQDCDVAIIVVKDMGNTTADEAAKAAWAAHGLGTGADQSGVLLFLSMAERDYALIAHGYGNTAFTDYGKATLLDDYVLPQLGQNKYAAGFRAFLDQAERYLTLARAGSPVDVPGGGGGGPGGSGGTSAGNSQSGRIAVTVGLPLLVSLLICLYWRSKMKTARIATQANDYITVPGLVLTARDDSFLFRTETRVLVEDSSSNRTGGGFGGTSIGGGGFSARVGKF